MNEPRRQASRSGPLVGRNVELAVLAERVEAARAGRTGFVFAVGESGIGKTRLMDEAAEAARERGLRVLRGRAASVGTSRMRPFAEALLGLAREGWAPPDGLGPYLAVLGRLVPDWRADGQAAGDAPPFIQGEAILRVLGMSGTEGTLLILEDLHDADPDTIATLEYLLDNAAGLPLAVFCTTRDVPGQAVELAEYARRRDPDAVLALARLDRSGTVELAAALLGTDRRGLGEELREALYRDGAGNPLAVTEILRELVASGALVQRDGGWTLGSTRRPRAPRSLARSVAEQLRREEPAARRVLRTAAILGETFPADLLGAAAGVQDAELWGALDSAVRGQLLVPAVQEGWYAFRHPLLERAVQDRIAAPDRKTLALSAAAAIERRVPAMEEWRLRAAVLRESAGDGSGAGALFAAAGRTAAESGSPALAVDLLGRAIGCLPAGRHDEVWAELTGLLVTALGRAGRYQEAFDWAEQIEAATRAGLEPEAAADLRLRLARVALRAGRSDQVAPHLEAARQAIGDQGGHAQLAELDAIEAFLAVEAAGPGRAEHVETLAWRAIYRSREAGVPIVECDALLTLGYHYGNRRPEQALESYQRAYRVARENNLNDLRSEALLLLGSHQWMWHADPAGLRTAEAEAIADGAVMETRLAQVSLAVDALFRAEFDAAEELLDTAWQDIARLKLPWIGTYALAIRAVLHAHRGREEELAAAVAEFDRWRGESDEEVPLVRGQALAVSALLRGDLPAARAHLDALRAPDGGFGATKYYLSGEYGLAALVQAADGSADWARHRAIAEQTAAGLPWNRQFVEFAHAVLAGRDADRAGSEAAIARALEASAPFALARHLGLSLVAASAARDGWGEPVRWLQEAEAFFKGIGLTAAARTCRDRLREVGGPTRQWREGSPDVPRGLWAVGVTVREYEVFQLVARHWTNREIAAELHLSHRTVERHVANLLAKTGVAGRRDLAARADQDAELRGEP
jgi:DNA-binding CsgD family transcriptional regulator